MGLNHYAWNTELIANRGISFERIIYYIERAGLLEIINHSNSSKYPNLKNVHCLHK